MTPSNTLSITLSFFSSLYLLLPSFLAHTPTPSLSLSLTPTAESFGGAIAQMFVQQYPERTYGLVLLSSPAKIILPADIEWKLKNLIPILEFYGEFYIFLTTIYFIYLLFPFILHRILYLTLRTHFSILILKKTFFSFLFLFLFKFTLIFNLFLFLFLFLIFNVVLGYYFPSFAQYVFARLHVDDVCDKNDPQYAKVK